MVLHHVAQHARAVVVAAAALDVHRLGDVELDVVDEVLVPERLEHAVAEAERYEILDRLLAQVVIDPVDLVLVPVGEDVRVELQRRGQVGPEGLLHDDPLPAGAVLESGLVQLLAQQAEEAGRGGEVEEDVAADVVLAVQRGHLGLELLERAGVVARPRVVEAADQLVPHRLVEGLAGVEALDVLAHPLAERLRRQRVHGGAQQREVVGQQAVAGEVVERRHQQPLGEVAGGAEDQEHARLARGIGAVRVHAATSQDMGVMIHGGTFCHNAGRSAQAESSEGIGCHREVSRRRLAACCRFRQASACSSSRRWRSSSRLVPPCSTSSPAAWTRGAGRDSSRCSACISARSCTSRPPPPGCRRYWPPRPSRSAR